MAQIFILKFCVSIMTYAAIISIFIIGWEGLRSAGGFLRVGPRGGANWVGYQESGNTPGFVRAKRGRARSALFWRVLCNF